MVHLMVDWDDTEVYNPGMFGVADKEGEVPCIKVTILLDDLLRQKCQWTP